MTNNMDLSESEKIQHILTYYINGLTDKKFFCLKGLKDFDNIISKPSSSSFAEYTFDDLTDDIDDLVVSTADESIKKNNAAKRLRKHWSVELEDIRRCIDCHYYWTTGEDDSYYFARLCTKPHLLVYVQESVEDGSRWWPAKVLTVNNDDNNVKIECFGDHLRADYHFDKCILYSETDLQTEIRNAENSKNENKRDEYVRAFEELGKYIKNIEEKYGDESFVPASSDDQTITDVNQHLNDMFRTAFIQNNQVTANDNELQATVDNNQYDDDDIDGSFNATISPASQGYGSQYSGYFGLSDDPDNSVESEIPPNRQPRLLTAAEIKAEYAQYYANTDTGDEPDLLPQGSDASSTVGTVNGRRETRKRKNDDDSVVMEKPAAKRVTRSSERINNANNDVIVIDDDTEIPSTSSQNHDKRSPATNDGNFNLLLEEFAEVCGNIALNERQNKQLLAQRATIKAKLDKYKINANNPARNNGSFNLLLDEFAKISGKIALNERENKQLLAQRAIIKEKFDEYNK